MTMTKDEVIDAVSLGHPDITIAGKVATAMIDPKQVPDVVDASLPVIVGVTGYARHGKNTIGEQFAQHGFQMFAFADQLKSMALALNPFIKVRREDWRAAAIPVWDEWVRLADLVEEAGWEGAKQNPEVRRFLQALGTEGVRKHIGDDAWVDALAKKVAESGARHIVVTDVRFPNEAAWIHSRGGKLLRVTRLNDDGTEYDNGVSREHESEKYIPTLPADADIIARNLNELSEQTALAVSQIMFGGVV